MCSVSSNSLWPCGQQPTRLLSARGILPRDYWCGLPLPSPGDLPDPGMETVSRTSPALAGGFFTTVLPGRPFNGLSFGNYISQHQHPFSTSYPNHICRLLCFQQLLSRIKILLSPNFISTELTILFLLPLYIILRLQKKTYLRNCVIMSFPSFEQWCSKKVCILSYIFQLCL